MVYYHICSISNIMINVHIPSYSISGKETSIEVNYHFQRVFLEHKDPL